MLLLPSKGYGEQVNKDTAYKPDEEVDEAKYQAAMRVLFDAFENISKNREELSLMLNEVAKDYNLEELDGREQEEVQKRLYEIRQMNAWFRKGFKDDVAGLADVEDEDVQKRIRELNDGYDELDKRVEEMAQKAGIKLEDWAEMMYK